MAEHEQSEAWPARRWRREAPQACHPGRKDDAVPRRPSPPQQRSTIQQLPRIWCTRYQGQEAQRHFKRVKGKHIKKQWGHSAQNSTQPRNPSRGGT